MTREILVSKKKEEVLEFIRLKLKFDESIIYQLREVDKDLFKKEHRRFEMSGYENETGDCTRHNQAVLNEFANLGIYDHTHYLFLDFHKGMPNLYMQYWGEPENLEFDLSGMGTTEIIYFIFEKTIFTGGGRRRRD